MRKLALCLAAVAATLATAPALAADPARQAEVARRGPQVMPFSLEATRHVFTKTREGGVQQVLVRQRGDARQVRLVREHLREIRAQFLKGDFSGPSHIHGSDMPGLAALRAAAPGAIAIDYQDVPGGAQLRYRTTHAHLVAALHQWFDAQVADHGKDAMAGHPHHGSHGAHGAR